MRKNLFICIALLFISQAISASDRESILINFGWKFHLGEVSDGEKPQTDDSQWRNIDLPYDYQLNMPWKETASRARGFKEMSGAWFRKTIRPDEAWRGKQVLIDFEGLMYYGDVYLNGEKIGSTEYGYCGFECDVTKKVKYGQDNLLAVYTNTGVEGGSRWYTGGGINRDVRIIVKDNMSMSRHGVYVTASKGDADVWTVNVQAELRGSLLKKGKVEFTATIYDAEGNKVASSEKTAAPSQSRLNMCEVPIKPITITSPRLWNIVTPNSSDQTRNLYTCEVTMYVDGQVTDKISKRFGFRTIDYGADFGFKLNGKKVFLQGIANHTDFGGVGVATYRRAIERQLRQLKAFGFNAVRCSHNPYPEVFYDLCDEMGFAVIDEFVDKWSNDGNCWGGREPFLNMWPDLMTEWVKRDRNHPCVIMWSLGNEMQHRKNAWGYKTDDWGVTTFRILDTFLKRYDKTRPSTAAMFPAHANGQQRTDSGFTKKENIIPPEISCISDIASFNYRYGDYAQYKQYNPNLIILQSEASVHDLITPFLHMDRATTVGLCYWGAIEYWGESDGWPKKGWNYSFFDHTLKPYPRAWLLRSCYVENEPQVHIGVLESEQSSVVWNDIISGRAEMSHFYWRPNRGDSITLEVSSNCEEVELVQNGKSLGTKKNDYSNDKLQNKFLWKDIAWQPGKIVAIAKNKGKEVARHKLQSPGEAKRLRIEVENANDWKADGMDLQYIRITAVDHKGNIVENYKGELTVELTGEAQLLALDNGNHYTGSSFDKTSTQLYRGGALLILRSTRKSGKVQVKASVAGIAKASATLTTNRTL